MGQALDELTEKEKEALRLLLAGHDAKSSAHTLGISVHTLNDRLRSARRKLGVTSSKHAARILANAEGSTPESLVRKPLGVREQPEIQDNPPAADRSESGLIHLAARRKGLLIMSLTLALSLAVFAVVPSQTPSASDTSTQSARPTASELQARRWLGLIDSGLFDQSYEEAGQALRDEYALGRWKFGLTLRMTKGNVEDRRLASVTQIEEFGGRTDGEFALVTFNSLFEYNNRQVERVVLERIGSDWKVVDYEITSADSAAD